MMKFNTKIQHGFSMITAIFLLVVLGTLGAMMTSFFVSQQQSAAQDVMGARAYQAARAGIEWAAYNVSITPANTPWAGCVASTNPGALGVDLLPFAVIVNCIRTGPITEGAATLYTYSITSTATTGGAVGSSNYIERQLTATLGH